MVTEGVGGGGNYSPFEIVRYNYFFNIFDDFTGYSSYTFCL